MLESPHVEIQRKNRVIQGHLMAVRDMNEGMQKMAYVEDQDIIRREFGEKLKEFKIKTVGSAISWSTR